MRRNNVKKTKHRKINKMTKENLASFVKELEKANQANSKVYSMAVKQLSTK